MKTWVNGGGEFKETSFFGLKVVEICDFFLIFLGKNVAELILTTKNLLGK